MHSVSETSRRPRAMAMGGIPRSPTVCRPLPPPGPRDASLQSRALPFAPPPWPPLSLRPPFPVSHFCEHIAMEAAALDLGSGRGECECGHSCPLRGTRSGEGRSTTAAQFGRWGACWRLKLTEEGRALRENWADHWESSQKRLGS